MLNIIIKIVISIFYISLSGVISSEESKEKDTVKWSEYQGKKNWNDAKEHCKSLKMRLPTISELKLAIETGTTKSWRKNGIRYWAINKNMGSDNSTFKVISILEVERDKMQENHKTESQVGVFCANVSEDSIESDTFRELIESNAPENEIQKARNELGVKMYSEYQWKLSWDEANKKCKLMKMRLPSISELRKASDLGILKSWSKDGGYYWSSTPYDADSYYGLAVSYGDTYGYDRSNNLYVRCRR